MARTNCLTNLLIPGLLFLAASAQAQPVHKLALVIGISGYEDRVGRLPKAEGDAKSVGAALEKITAFA